MSFYFVFLELCPDGLQRLKLLGRQGGARARSRKST